MPKYSVYAAYTAKVMVTVEAEDKDEAFDKACDKIDVGDLDVDLIDWHAYEQTDTVKSDN